MQEQGLINQWALNFFKSGISVYKDLACNYHEKWKDFFPEMKILKLS